MKVLILGAGATGGYFGGRIAHARTADVTFLARRTRADRLKADGLVIRDEAADQETIRIHPVRTTTVEDLEHAYDVVIVACKAYDLADALAAVRPAVGPGTFVLPLLNGIRHLDDLDEAFGRARVLGGLCHIAAALTPTGEIRHLNRLHLLAFGERDTEGMQGAFCDALDPILSASGFEARRSSAIVLEMWEKFVFLATLAGMTCLMRASVGDIEATDTGKALTLELLSECANVAEAAGYPARPEHLERTRLALTERGSSSTASMLRDLEAGGDVEGEHVLGDMLARARAANLAVPILRVAYCHVQTYARRRSREHATGS